MLEVSLQGTRLRIGERCYVSFQRTLRIPDDGQDYPLPPGLGPFPIERVADYVDRVPPAWRERGGVFIPMYQREALWLGLGGARWKPNAIKIGVGGINAVSGLSWDEMLHDDPQDYVVCPNQPWLDGINTGAGSVRQFVAMPLGGGYTVEAQLTGREEVGGIQLLAFEPIPSRFPDQPPPEPETGVIHESVHMMAPVEMGLGAGGHIVQKIYPDPYGVDTWDPDNRGDVFVHLVNSAQYRAITGKEPPPTPIDARTYTERGYPWFAWHDEIETDLPPAPPLVEVKTVRERDDELGVADQDEPGFAVDPDSIVDLYPSGRRTDPPRQ